MKFRFKNSLSREVYDLLKAGDVFRLLLTGEADAYVPYTEMKYRAKGSYNIYAETASAMAGAGVGIIGLLMSVAQVSNGMSLWGTLRLCGILHAKLRRPKYYPEENMRRRKLAQERRRIRDRFTTNPCPTPSELLGQYKKIRVSAIEALKFGSLLCDLEAYCDNSLVKNVEGVIAGRNPGVKGWIAVRCPELTKHYSNAMRYKGLAEKFRQVIGAADPIPAAVFATMDEKTLKGIMKGKVNRVITVRNNKENGLRSGKTASGMFALDAEKLQAAWGKAQELLSACKKSETKTCNDEDLKEAEIKNNKNGLRCGIVANRKQEEIDGLRSGTVANKKQEELVSEAGSASSKDKEIAEDKKGEGDNKVVKDKKGGIDNKRGVDKKVGIDKNVGIEKNGGKGIDKNVGKRRRTKGETALLMAMLDEKLGLGRRGIIAGDIPTLLSWRVMKSVAKGEETIA